MYPLFSIQRKKSFVRLVMNENWVLDASPIILLGKADLLKTVSPLAKIWIIPEGVIREVEAKRPIESYLSEISYGSEVVK